MKQLEDKYRLLLVRAIRRFYQTDAVDFFRNDIIDERPMAGCIYRYLWAEREAYRKDDFEPNVDTEYRKAGDDEKVIEACVKTCANKQCRKVSDCVLVIKNNLPKGTNIRNISEIEKGIRPDIILHRRYKLGKDNNGLAVEIKREGAENVLFDQAKLMFLTCEEAAGLQYKLGAFVMLREQFAQVGIYRGGDVVAGYKVDKKRWRKLSEADIERRTWLAAGKQHS